MASNTYYSGDGYDEINFDRPVNHINLFVDAGTIFGFGINSGNYVTVPPGFYSISIGPTLTLYIASNGRWELITTHC